MPGPTSSNSSPVIGIDSHAELDTRTAVIVRRRIVPGQSRPEALEPAAA
jgi:hypothetical protein